MRAAFSAWELRMAKFYNCHRDYQLRVKVAADEVELAAEDNASRGYFEAGLGWVMKVHRVKPHDIVEELSKRHPNTTFELQTVPLGYDYVKINVPRV